MATAYHVCRAYGCNLACALLNVKLLELVIRDFWPENWQEHVFDINNDRTHGEKAMSYSYLIYQQNGLLGHTSVLLEYWKLFSCMWYLPSLMYQKMSTDIYTSFNVFWSKNLGSYLLNMQRGNFISTSTSIGVRAQLTTLSTIMKSVDPKLHEHLGTVIWSYMFTGWLKESNIYILE